MITLIVPTRNRAHTLKQVVPSYFSQNKVTELIFVSDAGSDNSSEVIAAEAVKHPSKRLLIITNSERCGASMSRNIGVAQSTNPYVLFCDDDEFLEFDYASICLEKLLSCEAAVVSGRRVYMRDGETPENAVVRFGTGLRATAPFRRLLCEYVNGATFSGDIELPFTNAIILTTRQLLIQYPFDGFYSKGNGYREETDFQMNLYIRGLRIIVTNGCHSIHLPLRQVRVGGQRTSSLARLFWSVYYTNYFFKKYYKDYAKRVGIRAPRSMALTAFVCFAVYRETLRPLLYRLWVLTSARRLRHVQMR